MSKVINLRDSNRWEVESVVLEMKRAQLKSHMIIRITKEGKFYSCTLGDELVWIKKRKRCSPFCADAGVWIDSKGYDVNGTVHGRDLLYGLLRCGYEMEIEVH